MIIPVRIRSDARPLLANDRRFTVRPDHPLAIVPCPVCDELLAGRVCVLIVAGIAPEDRKPGGYTTGAAVAVHAACAGVRDEEPPPENDPETDAEMVRLFEGDDRATMIDDPDELDRELVDRVMVFFGHIEDMPGDERLFLLGALAGAMERRLRAVAENVD